MSKEDVRAKQGEKKTRDGASATPGPAKDSAKKAAPKPAEIGGPKGPEPTRYGDWERKGIAVDF